MDSINNDDVKKMLEMLKEQTESTNTQEKFDTQTTEENLHTDDDIKDMLKKQFSSEVGETNAISDDYSFDNVEDFVPESVEDEITEEFEDKIEAEPESLIEEETVDEIEEELIQEDNEFSFVVEKIPTEPIENEADDIVEDALVDEVVLDENNDDFAEESITDDAELTDSDPCDEAPVQDEQHYEETENIVPEIETYVQEPDVSVATYDDIEENEPVSEESINYDEVLEGQQGTVFNQFVEDFTGELDDVVFEAEITESRAPDKQYTIFEDWEQIIKDKNYATAEEEIIPPSMDELEQTPESIEKEKGKTDYFNPIVSDNDLDAVDIALMVALGGESELNQTVGFEKIRQAVHDVQEEEEANIEGKRINGFTGEEYSSISQNIKIKKQYKTDKVRLLCQTIGTALFTLILVIYEVFGWTDPEVWISYKTEQECTFRVIIGILLMLICAVISFDKLVKLIKESMSFSSLSYIGALITFIFSIVHDILILMNLGWYVSAAMTFHSVSAFLFLLSLVYDLFDHIQQSYMFNIVSLSDKKLVLEPYGKINTDENDVDVVESDSYCISRVPSVKNYFARTSKPSSVSMSKLIPLVLSFSVAICVMLLLLLMPGENNVLFGFIITLSFLLVCTCIFESEFAFFIVHRVLKKYKTGILGKSSVAEYGKCNVVYFDDFNVFNKKSVRTKGLKLYDNNEIYRILYHTQAVFSKVGGPLKGVFEFATTEMTHSKKVEIKEISNEGISAIVDGRTSVLIGTGAFMRSRYIHPSYTSADLKLEESGEDSIMFIALNGVLGAKLYVTYQFSSEFERLARKLTAKGVAIGIRSADPNINNKWAKRYGEMKKFSVSIVRPTLKELKQSEKSIESGVVSVKNVRALSEALMMCIKLSSLESVLSKVRMVALVLMGILAFALVLLSGINTMTVLALVLASAFCTSIMALLTYFYIKN